MTHKTRVALVALTFSQLLMLSLWWNLLGSILLCCSSATTHCTVTAHINGGEDGWEYQFTVDGHPYYGEGDDYAADPDDPSLIYYQPSFPSINSVSEPLVYLGRTTLGLLIGSLLVWTLFYLVLRSFLKEKPPQEPPEPGFSAGS
ncbi:MAG: hypothetical protein KF760_20115 [Candidatus Eremiobacteraeota bacterium]|nr:hypothetical protein [Candidatus Eremiobacteraeota bacterium]MCW5868176.1 hypothetical protein [Candidatus Eremiobacteraeota bacterium]